MVQLPAAFNPSAPGQEGVGDWTPIPAGDYQAHVKDSSMVATKDNPKHFFLKLDWEIMSGETAGRIMIQRLNLVNSNPVAVEIAQKHLKSICDAMAILGPIGDSVVLHGKPITISIVLTKPTASYGPGNDIKKYEPIGAVAGTAPTTQIPTATPTVAAPTVSPPWAAAATQTPPVPETPAPVETPDAPTEQKPPWVK
jgi:hypothetical protein